LRTWGHSFFNAKVHRDDTTDYLRAPRRLCLVYNTRSRGLWRFTATRNAVRRERILPGPERRNEHACIVFNQCMCVCVVWYSGTSVYGTLGPVTSPWSRIVSRSRCPQSRGPLFDLQCEDNDPDPPARERNTRPCTFTHLHHSKTAHIHRPKRPSLGCTLSPLPQSRTLNARNRDNTAVSTV